MECFGLKTLVNWCHNHLNNLTGRQYIDQLLISVASPYLRKFLSQLALKIQSHYYCFFLFNYNFFSLI